MLTLVRLDGKRLHALEETRRVLRDQRGVAPVFLGGIEGTVGCDRRVDEGLGPLNDRPASQGAGIFGGDFGTEEEIDELMCFAQVFWNAGKGQGSQSNPSCPPLEPRLQYLERAP